MQQDRYAKPPIAEAIIDFRTRSATSDLAKLGELRDAIASTFPLVSPIQSVTLNIMPPQGEPMPSYNQQIVGYRLASSDNTRVIQIQQQGFTYSYLNPYTSWERFAQEAQEYWEIYREICEPGNIVRVATRFINNIAIDDDGSGKTIELEDYFTFYPEFPKSINPDITGVFMQIRQQIPSVPNANATLSFTNTVVDAHTPTPRLAFVLDFDLAVEGVWAANGNDAWQVLAEFRTVKNTYFESSITDKCRRLFK
jgi:uncharacterized protein (TIGR04255 family)